MLILIFIHEQKNTQKNIITQFPHCCIRTDELYSIIQIGHCRNNEMCACSGRWQAGTEPEEIGMLASLARLCSKTQP